MKIGQFKCLPGVFVSRGLNEKFDYNQPVQIVGAVADSGGLRYLTLKQKKSFGSAQFGWFPEHKFQCFAEGMTIQSVKTNAVNNLYYWVHEENIRIYDSTFNKSNSNVSSIVLTRFKEDDE